MKCPLLSIVLMLAGLAPSAFCQISIESCQQKAKDNYPLVKQRELFVQLEDYTVANARKGYLPQVALSARATYQSDVTELPAAPNGALSKDQYQAIAEVNKTIFDGGVIKSQIKIARASSEIEKQKLKVDLYALNDRVNQLFFGILLLTEQLNQNETLQKELETNYTRIAAYIQNGVANQSDLNAVRVEQLNAQQKQIEMKATQKSYREMLSVMIGEPIAEDRPLIKPPIQVLKSSGLQNNRPELQLFDAQSDYFSSQTSIIASSNKPKLSLFFQGCYGRPGLNMLKNDFTPYYIGGLRLSWNFGGLYTQRDDIHKIKLNMESVGLQKETFLFNTNLKVIQQKIDIEKFNEIIKGDDEIIVLRSSIKKSAEAKVENGTITVSDLIREINAENLAIQAKSLHEIQLLLSLYALKNTTNE
jgi:outer membrane protein TolC